MADGFGLLAAIEQAKKGGVDVAGFGNYKKLVTSLDTVRDQSEEVVEEYKNLERQINRGAEPVVKTFQELSAKCKKETKAITGDVRVLEKAVETQRKALRTAKDKIKLIDAIDAKLDKVGAFLLEQGRRRDPGEIVLALLSKRGQAAEKGAKRASSVDAKKPGTGLQKEIEAFVKEHEDALKPLLGEKRAFQLLDQAAAEHGSLKPKLQVYLGFLASPKAADADKVEAVLKDVAEFDGMLHAVGRTLDNLDKAFRRAAAKLGDKKAVAKSLQGSLVKVKELFDEIEEESRPKGGTGNRTPRQNVEAALRKVPVKAG